MLLTHKASTTIPQRDAVDDNFDNDNDDIAFVDSDLLACPSALLQSLLKLLTLPECICGER
jgi:hypothetical protein